MNLVKILDDLKNLPNQAIMAYANGSNPEVPPYAALAELNRRKQMEQHYQNANANPNPPSVKQEIEQSVVKPGQASPQPQGIAAALPQAQPPQPVPATQSAGNSMKSGGIAKFASGGHTSEQNAAQQFAALMQAINKSSIQPPPQAAKPIEVPAPQAGQAMPMQNFAAFQVGTRPQMRPATEAVPISNDVSLSQLQGYTNQQPIAAAHGGLMHHVPHHMYKFAHGGILAFDGATNGSQVPLANQTAMYVAGAQEAAKQRAAEQQAAEQQALSSISPDNEAGLMQRGPQTPLSSLGQSISQGLSSIGSGISRALQPKTPQSMMLDTESAPAPAAPPAAPAAPPAPPAPPAAPPAPPAAPPAPPAAGGIAQGATKGAPPAAPPGSNAAANGIAQIVNKPRPVNPVAPVEPAPKLSTLDDTANEQMAAKLRKEPSLKDEFEVADAIAKHYGVDSPAGQVALKKLEEIQQMHMRNEEANKMNDLISVLHGWGVGGAGGAAETYTGLQSRHQAEKEKHMLDQLEILDKIDQRNREEKLKRGENVGKTYGESQARRDADLHKVYGEAQANKRAAEQRAQEERKMIEDARHHKALEGAEAARLAKMDLSAAEIAKLKPEEQETYAKAQQIKSGQTGKLDYQSLASILQASLREQESARKSFDLANAGFDDALKAQQSAAYEDAKKEARKAKKMMENFNQGKNIYEGIDEIDKSAKTSNIAPPSLQEFLAKAKASPQNKGVTDKELTDYYNSKYGK